MKLVNIKATYRPSNTGFYNARLLQTINLPKVKKQMQTVKKDICGSLPSATKLGDDDICSKSLVIKRVAAGSL